VTPGARQFEREHTPSQSSLPTVDDALNLAVPADWNSHRPERTGGVDGSICERAYSNSIARELSPTEQSQEEDSTPHQSRRRYCSTTDTRQTNERSMQDTAERRAELKLKIAKAAMHLLESPEEHVPKLRELLPLCSDKVRVVLSHSTTGRKGLVSKA
jgi:hypothetical protein